MYYIIFSLFPCDYFHFENIAFARNAAEPLVWDECHNRPPREEALNEVVGLHKV